ncbi:MAG TPA: hypothetical protein VF736_08915 [Pyrinomonadaceae bacterium]
MGAEREDGRVASEGAAGACVAAHERAVMTVRVTLLLLIIGVALLVCAGPGGALP